MGNIYFAATHRNILFQAKYLRLSKLSCQDESDNKRVTRVRKTGTLSKSDECLSSSPKPKAYVWGAHSTPCLADCSFSREFKVISNNSMKSKQGCGMFQGTRQVCMTWEQTSAAEHGYF